MASPSSAGHAGSTRAPDPSTPPEAAEGPGARTSVGRVARAATPLLVLILLLVVDFPLCPSRWFLGVPCPGCGLTRATGAMAQLDLQAVYVFHPLAPLLVPVVGWMLLRTTLVSAGLVRSDAYDPLARLPRWVWVGVLVLLFGTWLARLFGALGGHPDPIDPAGGALGQALGLAASLFR